MSMNGVVYIIKQPKLALNDVFAVNMRGSKRSSNDFSHRATLPNAFTIQGTTNVIE